MAGGPPSFDVAHLAQAVRWWMWIAAAGLLVIARFLPLRLPRRSVGLVAVGSIVVAVLGLHVIVTAIRAEPRVERTATLDPLIAEVARTYRPERPALLVIGSSRATLGLDGAALEQKLAARRDVQVLQFSATGHYALEQLTTTRRLLERMRPERLTVLVELGTEIDLGVPEVLVNTTRGIELFDARAFWVNFRLWRAARAGNADDPAYSVRQLLRTLAHAGQHHLGIGLLFDLGPAAPPGGSPGFVPFTDPVAPASTEAVRQALALPASSIQVPSDRAELVAMVRGELVDELRDAIPGPLELVFFFPPTADVSLRAHAPQACAAVAHLGPCLHMTDDEVRALLPPGVWLDPGHLTRDGAALYTDWLAARLAEKLGR